MFNTPRPQLKYRDLVNELDKMPSDEPACILASTSRNVRSAPEKGENYIDCLGVESVEAIKCQERYDNFNCHGNLRIIVSDNGTMSWGDLIDAICREVKAYDTAIVEIGVPNGKFLLDSNGKGVKPRLVLDCHVKPDDTVWFVQLGG